MIIYFHNIIDQHGFKVFVVYLPVSLVANMYVRKRVRPFNIPGFHFLTVTVIDVKMFCGAAERFMLKLDLANRSEHHIWGHFPPLRFSLKCS